MIYAIKTKMHMDPRVQGALILGAGGALGGGIGGHLVDRKAKRDGNWFKRNKSAIIGSLGGAAVGGGIGALVGGGLGLLGGLLGGSNAKLSLIHI